MIKRPGIFSTHHIDQACTGNGLVGLLIQNATAYQRAYRHINHEVVDRLTLRPGNRPYRPVRTGRSPGSKGIDTKVWSPGTATDAKLALPIRLRPERHHMRIARSLPFRHDGP